MQNTLQADLRQAEFNAEGHAALTGVVQWGFIAAIVGLASLAIELLLLAIDVVQFSDSGVVSALFGSLFTTAISLVLNLTLLAASQKIKTGILRADQEEFVMGLVRLTRYFKISGIITIIALVIFAIAGIFFLLFAAPSVSF